MHFTLILYKVTAEINNGRAADEFYRFKFSHAPFPLKEATCRFKEPPTWAGTPQLFLLKISTSRPGFNSITIKHQRFILQEKQTNMEKQRAWSTTGTFSLPFLHDWLFGGKGHRKEYNPFFTFSDSLKCLTRKTVSSTPHSSLQPELIYSVNRGQDICVDTSPLIPTAHPSHTERHRHTELALSSKPRRQNFSFLLFWLFHLPRKTSRYLQSI